MKGNIESIAASTSIDAEVKDLLNYVASAVGNTYEFGNLTPQLYDTAWVSMLRDPKDKDELLFTECFEYVLRRQLPNGGWESYDSDVDGVLNNLAGLLALRRNASAKNSGLDPHEIDRRVSDASRCLKSSLDNWDIATCDYVGFEIIVPSMLEALEREGITFQFASKALLIELNRQKLSKIHPSVWTGKIQTTITHSLEAFLGKADFSGLKDQLLHGGMGSSPSSTAAYLMSLSEWDPEVAKYLETVINSKPKDSIHRGGVPGMYPTTGFECLWIVATLIEGGFDLKKSENTKPIISLTNEFYESLDGLASGFSRSSVADADDTAKSVIVRNLLGTPTNAHSLVATFEGKTHFKTYPMERHPSVTTNCNVLSAMLLAPDMHKYIRQIEKCARFLCGSWLKSDMVFMDKWNISELYTIVLMSESLMRLLEAWDAGRLKDFSMDLISKDIPLVLFQFLLRILLKQNDDGSWGHKPSREITAYGIISLANLASLPFASSFLPQIQNAVERGRQYIADPANVRDIEYVWIAKVSYSPINISRAYIAAAQNIQISRFSIGKSFNDVVSIPEKNVQKYTKMFAHLGAINTFPEWRIRGSIVEACLFLKTLVEVKLDLFSRNGMKTDDYFDFIAMTFCCANNLNSTFLEADVLLEMMIMVLRVYQVDEFVEHIIGKESPDTIKELKSTLSSLHAFNGETTTAEQHNKDGINSICSKLRAFAGSVLDNRFVQNASDYDRAVLTYELRTCLLSHLQQLEHSELFYAKNGSVDFEIPCGSYHSWVLSKGASHSCAPLSLAFLRCLLSDPAGDKMNSSEVCYLTQDIWMHLSAKCRMENDLGSQARDRKERNLNSMDFPEFSKNSGPKTSKEELQKIIGYEKQCCQMAMTRLAAITGPENKVSKSLQFYYFLSDIYSDIYAMRDISCEKA